MITMFAGIMLLAHCSAGCAGLTIATLQDTDVPALTAALQHDNPRVRYYAVRCLGEINTQEARTALSTAFADGMPDVRKYVPYVLAWHPHPEAEQVYLAYLSLETHSSEVRWRMRNVIKALGEIRSRNAVPLLRAMCDNPTDWYNYYAAIQALRKIEGQELPPEIIAALNCLREAQYGNGVNEDTLALAMQVVRKNLPVVMPDVCDMFFLPMPKQILTGIRPDVEIIANAGVRAYPYLRISLRANDGSTTLQTLLFIKALALEDDFRAELQQLAAANQNRADITSDSDDFVVELAATNQNRAGTTVQTDDDIYQLSLGGLSQFPTGKIMDHRDYSMLMA